MDRTTFKRLVLERLQYLSPEAYAECVQLANPPVKDLTLLPAIMETVVGRNERSPDSIPFMIAVAYYLIAPHKLHSQSIKLGLGIRDVISNGMGFNHPEVVNHYSRYVIPNFKNARYKERVMQEAEAVLQTVLNQSLKD